MHRHRSGPLSHIGVFKLCHSQALDLHKKIVEALLAFARKFLTKNHHIAIEATTNTWHVVTLLRPFVASVTVSNRMATRAIAHSKGKTDKVDVRQPSVFNQLRRQAYARGWVVYAQRPFAGPEQVLGYLARYTHRVAISNSRILSLDRTHVAFRWKDYACQNKKRKMTITAEEFLRRFLLHVLPKGFVRIRAFGFLANRHRSALLALCRQHLSVFPTIPVSSIVVPATIVPPLCPQCRTGHMQLVERMPSQLRYFRFHDTS